MTRDGIWPDQEVLQGATEAAGRHAADADADGRIAAEAIVTLTEAGFPGCFVPKRWGGAAATFDAVTKAVATVGEGCPSAAWISSLWAYNGRFGAYLPSEGQEEVWAKGPDTRIVSSMIAVGAEAQPCPDGWMLSGSWLYVSGVESADWALISSGLPREGDRHTRVLAVPKESFTYTNTWSTIGMRATGSHTLVVERAFVPEYRSFISDDMRQGMLPGATATAHSAPLFAVNGLTFAAPILGAARGALRLAEQHLGAGPSGPRAAARESSLIAYARAAGEIDASALLLSRVSTIASSKASTASPGDSGGTPKSAIRFHRPPAPIPSTTRPPESADSDVTVRASMGAGLVGRLVTLTKPEMRCVRPRTNPTAA